MTSIVLDRKRGVLRIGSSNSNIDRYVAVTVIYGVTHVDSLGDGWYDIHRGRTILGHITDVESVKEKW